MKVNTDAVLLGSWLELPKKDPTRERLQILDIGTGTGVIALMIAQRLQKDFCIKAIDIDAGAAEEADYNFKRSKWSGNICSKQISLQEFTDENGPSTKFDLIVTNPPYFNSSLRSPNSRKSIARHTDLLPYNAIVKAATEMLLPNGRLSLILPYPEIQEFDNQIESVSSTNGITLRRICLVKTTAETTYRRALMEYSRSGDRSHHVTQEFLTIQNSCHKDDFTDQYRSLTKDFYLKF